MSCLLVRIRRLTTMTPDVSAIAAAFCFRRRDQLSQPGQSLPLGTLNPRWSEAALGCVVEHRQCVLGDGDGIAGEVEGVGDRGCRQPEAEGREPACAAKELCAA